MAKLSVLLLGTGLFLAVGLEGVIGWARGTKHWAIVPASIVLVGLGLAAVFSFCWRLKGLET
jgi:hypothetical protein